MASRPLVIRLPGEDFTRLAERAQEEDRDPQQQARWLLRQALRAEQADDGRNQRRPEEARA